MTVALFAAGNGEIYDAPEYLAVGRNGTENMLFKLSDMILMPEGAQLMYLPGRNDIGWRKGEFVQLPGILQAVAAIKTDDNTRWHPYKYNTTDLAKKVNKVKSDLPNNSIVRQLAECSLEWHAVQLRTCFITAGRQVYRFPPIAMLIVWAVFPYISPNVALQRRIASQKFRQYKRLQRWEYII